MCQALPMDHFCCLVLAWHLCYVVQLHSLVSLQPHGLQHARLPCPSLSPGVCPNSSPLSQGCHRTISSSVAPFSFYLQSFPASGSFLTSRLFTSGGQNIGASASVFLWIFMDFLKLISFRIDWFDPRDCTRASQESSSSTTVWKHQYSVPKNQRSQNISPSVPSQ